MTEFRTEVVTSEEQFKGMRQEWNDLLAQSLTNTIFLTWEWIHTWWQVFGKGAELFIITVKNGKGELVAIAPLCIRKAKYYKFPVKEMVFIGMELSDRHDFIISGSNTQIIYELVSKIYENKSKWDIVYFEQIPDDSLLASARFSEDIRQEREISSFCPFVTLNGSWEVYFKSLSKTFRKDIRHKINIMNRLGKWEVLVERHVSDIEQTVRSMALIETKSRKQNTEKAFLSNKVNTDFLVRFCGLSMENRWLDYSTIIMNGTPVAYLLGFLYNNKYYAYNMAFSEDFHAASPGKLLLNEKIRWCFEHMDVAKEFDFLRGNTYIKLLWTSESRSHIRMVFFNDSLYPNIIRYVVFNIRPRIKKLFRKNH